MIDPSVQPDPDRSLADAELPSVSVIIPFVIKMRSSNVYLTLHQACSEIVHSIDGHTRIYVLFATLLSVDGTGASALLFFR